MKLTAFTLSACFASTAAFAPAFVSTKSGTCSSVALQMARTPFISGNWKLNPSTKAEAVQLATDISAAVTPSSPNADVALFVPYPFIEAAMAAAGSNVIVGAEVRKVVTVLD
jgi:triosephosphate isomerase